MRYILLLIILSFTSLSAKSEWEMIDNNRFVPGIDGHEFEFGMGRPVEINNSVFAMNTNSVSSIVYSEDYCMNWDTSLFAPFDYMGTSTRFYDLVKNDISLFVPADSGRLYRSFDKGETWDYYLFENDIHPIQHLLFVNENVGYVGMIDKHLLSKTTDGGKSWNPLPIVGNALPEVFSFQRLVASSEDHIIVVGFDLTITPTKLIFLETTDGGDSWHRFETEEFEKSKYVYFYYTNLTYHNGYYFVEYRYKNSNLAHTSLFKSKDFRTWEPIFISDTISGAMVIDEIKFYDNIGIAMGDAIFIVSTDNGETWVHLYDDNGESLRGFSSFVYLDDGYVYSQGTVFYIDDEGLKRARPKIFRYKLDLADLSVEMELSSLKVYPNPAKSVLNIEYDKKIKSLEILDMSGKNLLNTGELIPTNKQVLNIDYLTTGTYFVRINNKIYKKIIIQ